MNEDTQSLRKPSFVRHAMIFMRQDWPRWHSRHQATCTDAQKSTGEKRRMVDPYPILRQEYLQDLLLQEGDFVVHSRQEADHRTNEGFRRLWVSYCTIGPYVGPTSPAIPSTSSISSFSVHLIEPSFQHPLWIDWVGHFTTLSKPWQIKDPSLVLRQGENVFAEAEKLRRYNAALRRRVSPHNVQNLLKEHSEHSGEAEFEMVCCLWIVLWCTPFLVFCSSSCHVWSFKPELQHLQHDACISG